MSGFLGLLLGSNLRSVNTILVGSSVGRRGFADDTSVGGSLTFGSIIVGGNVFGVQLAYAYGDDAGNELLIAVIGTHPQDLFRAVHVTSGAETAKEFLTASASFAQASGLTAWGWLGDGDSFWEAGDVGQSRAVHFLR